MSRTGIREFRLAGSLGAVLAVTLALRTVAVVNATTVGFAYLITILVVAASWGFSESVVASVSAAVCFNYFFLPPLGTWRIADPENWVSLGTFLTSSLIASRLSDRAKRRTIEARARQLEMEKLYALSTQIMMASNQPAGSVIARELAAVGKIPFVALYERATDTVYYGGAEGPKHISGLLREAALKRSQSTDEKTGTVFAPISLGGECIGSIAIQRPALSNTAFQALLNLIAIGLENARSREIATRAQAARQSEDFKSTLLDGLAHEFKTPLTSIRAATTALLASSVRDTNQRDELLTIVDQEAERLSRLVTEAIHVARIEAGKIQLDRQLHSVNSLIEAVVNQMESQRDGRSLEVSVPRDLPPTLVDADLMQLALRQIIDNALKYSPRRSPIRISCTITGDRLGIVVHNQGEPLSQSEQTRIFDKFYRGIDVRNRTAGTGMGLSVAREILLAHGGDVRIGSSNERGTEFILLLPVKSEAA